MPGAREWNLAQGNTLLTLSLFQAFHICGGISLTQYSFLCPNGSLFNQEYFVCDW